MRTYNWTRRKANPDIDAVFQTLRRAHQNGRPYTRIWMTPAQQAYFYDAVTKQVRRPFPSGPNVRWDGVEIDIHPSLR